ncbi:hypothetical protein CIRMBP1296_00447 [Enterococcus cecorum]|nr:hypothetical protein CIRMBP1296_00447 [Enterococcus cecorum]
MSVKGLAILLLFTSDKCGNVPLQKRIIRKKLIEDIGISRQKYIGYMELTNEQFYKIIELGEINESFIIN